MRSWKLFPSLLMFTLLSVPVVAQEKPAEGAQVAEGGGAKETKEGSAKIVSS